MNKDVATATDAPPPAEPPRPTPWKVRTCLVRIIADDPAGMTIREVERRLAAALGVPLVDPVEVDVESLLELGVLEEINADDRRLRTTDAAARYLLGAEVLANE